MDDSIMLREPSIFSTPTIVALTSSTTLAGTARHLVKASANSAGYTLTIPNSKTHQIFNAGTVSLNVASATSPGTVNAMLSPGENVIAAWDVVTTGHLMFKTSASGGTTIVSTSSAIRVVTANALDTVDIGKPIQGNAIFNSLGTSPDPRGVLVEATSGTEFKVASYGAAIEIPNSLLASGTASGDLLEWSSTTNLYTKSGPSSTGIYILRLNSTGASTFNATVMVG